MSIGTETPPDGVPGVLCVPGFAGEGSPDLRAGYLLLNVPVQPLAYVVRDHTCCERHYERYKYRAHWHANTPLHVLRRRVS